MKIDFTQVNMHSSNVDKTSSYEPNFENKASQNFGYQLDISGTVKDNAVFGCYGKDGQGMTFNEYLQEKGVNGTELSLFDADSAMLRRNYMAVMSNSMSTEDFAELKKNGYDLNSMDLSDAVNVVDQIKIKLIEAGVCIKGYTDTIDSDTIESAVGTGSYSASITSKLTENDLPLTEENKQSVASAMDMIQTIEDSSVNGELNDNVKRMLISNGLAPSINNVFLSLYQSANYQTNNNFSDFDKIRNQVEELIKRTGAEVNSKTLSDAKWLFENDLPLNEESLNQLFDLNTISLPVDKDKLLDNIADALSLGLSSKDASLITNRRVHLEIRLSMTAEANRRLLQSNFSIDTKDLEKEIEDLKSIENKISSNNEASLNDAVSLFEETNTKVSEIKEMPAALVAHFSNNNPFTITDIYKTGNSLKADYIKANESYEALRTEIRTDLGDNIKNAFRNVPDILKEMNMEASQSNIRAVRILGYNQTEITPENIMTVKTADQQISRLIDHLTPGNVLKLIRNGINPLKQSVSELNEVLDSYNDDDAKNEKYSEYLIKLEKNSQINTDERESYIGIYRLIRQIESNDGAAIGTLLNSGAELSIKNLLSAVRTRKASGIDVSLSDSFGVLDDLSYSEKRIDTQISQAFDQSDYYKKETSDLLSLLDPEKLRNMWDEGKLTADTTIDDLYEEMASYQSEAVDELEKQYLEFSADEFRNHITTEKEVEDLLNNYDIPLSADNLYAASQILLFRGKTFKNIANLSDKISIRDNIDSQINSLFEELQNLDNKETMQLSYEKLSAQTNAMIEKEIADSAMTAEEFRNMCLLNKQMIITRQLAKEENYQIPIETENGYTSINLKIVHSKGTPEVLATMNIPDIGDLVAHMLVNDQKVSGYLMADSQEGLDFLTALKSDLDDKLNTDFAISKKSNLQINKEMAEKSESSNVSNSNLYKMAKTFIQTINERMK